MTKMRMRAGLRRAFWTAMLATTAAGCRDRAPAGDGGKTVDGPAAAGTMALELSVPREAAWNQEDSVRVTVVNGTGAQGPAARLELFVQFPVDVRVDSAAGEDSTLVSSGEGTRKAFAVAPLPADGRADFALGIRTPPAGLERRGAEYDGRDRFLVRARLVDASGRELALAQDTIRILAGSEVVAGGCGGVRDVAVSRYGIGPVRLRTAASAVRQLCPEARDTAWKSTEGTDERGLTVAVAGNPVLLVTVRDTVTRIVVEKPGLKTGAGAAVGSTLGELRALYGRACAGTAEGRVAVWFPAAPGVSFGLDPADTGGWADGQDPAALPEAAQVKSFWVRDGSDDCPAREER
ncbi:MAG TPA: hypothetical protein VFQ45_20140 [Longimicrobium sp.]|nr:hypothetical protein [Longimicrobium sp.]